VSYFCGYKDGGGSSTRIKKRLSWGIWEKESRKESVIDFRGE